METETDRRLHDTEYMKVQTPNSEATSSQQSSFKRGMPYKCLFFIMTLYPQAEKLMEMVCIFLLQIEPKISARRLNDFHMTYGQVFNTPSPFLRRFLIVFLILELLGMKLIWGVQGKREF